MMINYRKKVMLVNSVTTDFYVNYDLFYLKAYSI